MAKATSFTETFSFVVNGIWHDSVAEVINAIPTRTWNPRAAGNKHDVRPQLICAHRIIVSGLVKLGVLGSLPMPQSPHWKKWRKQIAFTTRGNHRVYCITDENLFRQWLTTPPVTSYDQWQAYLLTHA